MKKILLLTAAAGLILAWAAFILSFSFYPAPFRFMESVVCPPGMVIDEETVERNRTRRNSSAKCRNQDGEIVDVTARLLLTGLLPLSAALLLILFSLRIKSPAAEEASKYHIKVIKFGPRE